MVFGGPVFDRFDDEPAHHSALGGGFVAAGGGIGEAAIFIVAVVVAGYGLVKHRIFGGAGVVVHHIHDHPQAVVVQRFDHLFELADADGAIGRVGRITAFRHIIEVGVVAPVEFVVFQFGLIYRQEIEGGQQVDVGDAQGFDVVQPGGQPLGAFSSGFGQAEEFAFMLYARAGVGGEVAHVQFVEYDVSGVGEGGALIALPSFRVGGGEVDDLPALAVRAGRGGVGAGRFGQPLAIHFHLEGVEGALEAFIEGGQPGSLFRLSHRCFTGSFSSQPLAVKAQFDFLRSGRPQAKGGGFGGIPNAQAIAFVNGIIVVRLKGGFLLGGFTA